MIFIIQDRVGLIIVLYKLETCVYICMCMLCKFKYTCVCVCVYHLDLLVGKNVSLLYLMNQCRGCYIYTDRTPHGHQNLMNDINCCEKMSFHTQNRNPFTINLKGPAWKHVGYFCFLFFPACFFRKTPTGKKKKIIANVFVNWGDEGQENSVGMWCDDIRLL